MTTRIEEAQRKMVPLFFSLIVISITVGFVHGPFGLVMMFGTIVLWDRMEKRDARTVHNVEVMKNENWDGLDEEETELLRQVFEGFRHVFRKAVRLQSELSSLRTRPARVWDQPTKRLRLLKRELRQCESIANSNHLFHSINGMTPQEAGDVNACRSPLFRRQTGNLCHASGMASGDDFERSGHEPFDFAVFSFKSSELRG
jgi:hypothetical protein